MRDSRMEWEWPASATSRPTHLADVLPAQCMLGMVKYIDYQKDAFDVNNCLNYIVHKRVSFAHEREARAVVWKVAPGTPDFKLVGDQGMVVPVDLKALIQGIFVSPNSKPMLREVVEGLVVKYGLSASSRR
jgi:hypothetical protein